MRRHRPYLLPFAGLALALTLAPLQADAQPRYPPPDQPSGAPQDAGRPQQGMYFADIRLQITPKQAAVYVDGYHAGEVDDFDGTFQRLRLETGPHEIAVYLAGYRTLRELVHLSPGQARRISGTLERLAPGEADPGPPRPISPPEAADARRPPPGVDRDVPPPSAAPPRTSEVPPGPRPVTRYGTLSILVEPGSAELVVDGGERRKLGSSDDRLLIQVTAGRHRIEVTRSGYVAYSTEVEIEAGETLDLDISLVRDK